MFAGCDPWAAGQSDVLQAQGLHGEGAAQVGDSPWIGLRLGGGWQSWAYPRSAAWCIKPPRLPRLRDICHPSRREAVKAGPQGSARAGPKSLRRGQKTGMGEGRGMKPMEEAGVEGGGIERIHLFIHSFIPSTTIYGVLLPARPSARC